MSKIERSPGGTDNSRWLACVDRRPVGYAKLKQPFGPPGEPRPAAQRQKIDVLRDYLGQQAGAGCMQAILAQTVNRAPVFWLDVQRENGRAMCADFGFQAVGEHNVTIGARMFRCHLVGRGVA